MISKTRKNKGVGGAKTARPATLAGKQTILSKKPASLAKKPASKFSAKKHVKVKTFKKVKSLNNEEIYKKLLARIRSIRTSKAKMFDGLDIEDHAILVPVADVIGESAVLENFTEFLGRTGLEIYENPKVNSLRISASQLPPEFSGLAYDGSQWKGYEPRDPEKHTRTVYDSYSDEYKLQLPKTMNFCQSYAAFLWSTQGELTCKNHPNITFIKGKFAENIKKMASLWLLWIEDIYKYENVREWLEGIIAGISSDEINDIPHLYNAMKILSENDEEAAAFSQSK